MHNYYAGYLSNLTTERRLQMTVHQIYEPVIRREHAKDEVLILGFLKLVLAEPSHGFTGIGLDAHVADWVKKGINEFTITAHRASGNYVDFTMNIGEGDLSQPEKDVVSPLTEGDLQTLHSTIRLFPSLGIFRHGFPYI